jgi:hypothetical protein
VLFSRWRNCRRRSFIRNARAWPVPDKRFLRSWTGSGKTIFCCATPNHPSIIAFVGCFRCFDFRIKGLLLYLLKENVRSWLIETCLAFEGTRFEFLSGAGYPVWNIRGIPHFLQANVEVEPWNKPWLLHLLGRPRSRWKDLFNFWISEVGFKVASVLEEEGIFINRSNERCKNMHGHEICTW